MASDPTTDIDEAAPPSTDLVVEIVAAAFDRKAEELRVLELGAVTHFTDYFVVCSGSSRRQVQAIADAVERSLRDQGVKPTHVEGYGTGQWVLLDYGDVVTHVFQEDRRLFYGLEKLWADAPDVTGELLGTAPSSGLSRS